MQKIVPEKHWNKVLDSKSLLYLAHPLTSCGDVEDNRRQEEVIARQTLKAYDNISLIRPLTILNPKLTSLEAQNIYQRLLCVSDGIIVSGNWRESKGCQHELALAINLRLPIYGTFFDFPDYSSDYISDAEAINLGINISHCKPMLIPLSCKADTDFYENFN